MEARRCGMRRSRTRMSCRRPRPWRPGPAPPALRPLPWRRGPPGPARPPDCMSRQSWMSWAASSLAPSCHACCSGVAVPGSCPARAASQRSATCSADWPVSICRSTIRRAVAAPVSRSAGAGASGAFSCAVSVLAGEPPGVVRRPRIAPLLLPPQPQWRRSRLGEGACWASPSGVRSPRSRGSGIRPRPARSRRRCAVPDGQPGRVLAAAGLGGEQGLIAVRRGAAGVAVLGLAPGEPAGVVALCRSPDVGQRAAAGAGLQVGQIRAAIRARFSA